MLPCSAPNNALSCFGPKSEKRRHKKRGGIPRRVTMFQFAVLLFQFKIKLVLQLFKDSRPLESDIDHLYLQEVRLQVR